ALLDRRPARGVRAVPGWLYRRGSCDSSQMMKLSGRWFLAAVGLLAAAISSTAAAQDDEAQRPKMNLFYRWLEDWSPVADPRLRTEPLDRLKYIPLPFDDPKSYVSLGLTVRERFELNVTPAFVIVGKKGGRFLLHRLQFHVDVRLNAECLVFVHFEAVRAPL